MSKTNHLMQPVQSLVIQNIEPNYCHCAIAKSIQNVATKNVS